MSPLINVGFIWAKAVRLNNPNNEIMAVKNRFLRIFVPGTIKIKIL
jgi:hypothetical protein